MLHGDSLPVLDFESYPYRLNNAWRPDADITLVIDYSSLRRFKCNVDGSTGYNVEDQRDITLCTVYCMRQVAIPFNESDEIPS